jgi:hypothetical protein
MPSKYEASIKAKAIRLVREHAGTIRGSGLRSPRSRAGWG